MPVDVVVTQRSIPAVLRASRSGFMCFFYLKLVMALYTNSIWKTCSPSSDLSVRVDTGTMLSVMLGLRCPGVSRRCVALGSSPIHRLLLRTDPVPTVSGVRTDPVPFAALSAPALAFRLYHVRLLMPSISHGLGLCLKVAK